MVPRNRYLLLTIALLACALVFAACGDDDDDDLEPALGDDDDETDSADDPLAVAVALADTWIDQYTPEAMGWSWDSGVLMIAMWDLFEQTGDARYHDYVKAWMDYHIAVGYTITVNDYVPPARLALRLWVETGEPQYREVVDRARTYIFEDAERLPDGGINHMGWISGQQIWADTLFMLAFLLELGDVDGDAAAFDESVLQFEVFADHLRDADTGLYRHMYDAETDSVKPEVKDYWGRGNAWIVAASGIALSLLPVDHPGFAGIRDRMFAQVAAMGALIDESGRWHTIMNRPETYLESSVGPLLAFGVYQASGAVAVDEATLDIARAAVRGAIDQTVVDEAGGTLFLGTSYGTGPGTWEQYNWVLKGEQVSYGVGAAILAATVYAKMDAGGNLPAAHETPEDYIHPPEGDDSTEWGYFYLARGDFTKSLARYEEAIASDAANPAAHWGAGLIGGARFVFEVLSAIDSYFLGETSLFEFIGGVLDSGGPAGAVLSGHMEPIEAAPGFSRVMERFVIVEQGGSTAIGAVEVDAGEAFLLDALGHLLVGASGLVDALGIDMALALAAGTAGPEAVAEATPPDKEATLASALDEIVLAIDKLVEGIEFIDAETDDQSDDLIPANLLRLEGEFGLPGVLLPQPVDELLAGFGIDPDTLFGGDPMPQALIDLLEKVRGVLVLLRGLLPG